MIFPQQLSDNPWLAGVWFLIYQLPPCCLSLPRSASKNRNKGWSKETFHKEILKNWLSASVCQTPSQKQNQLKEWKTANWIPRIGYTGLGKPQSYQEIGRHPGHGDGRKLLPSYGGREKMMEPSDCSPMWPGGCSSSAGRPLQKMI